MDEDETDIDVEKRRVLENAERARRINSASIEAPVSICEVCGLAECDHNDEDAIVECEAE